MSTSSGKVPNFLRISIREQYFLNLDILVLVGGTRRWYILFEDLPTGHVDSLVDIEFRLSSFFSIGSCPEVSETGPVMLGFSPFFLLYLIL